MMVMTKRPSFFSIRYDLIETEKPLPFDLYVNSSVITGKEKFVKIFSSGGVLKKDEVESFHKKYVLLFVPEDQRKLYLKSLVKSKADDIQKAKVIKESALEYLHNIFDKEKEFSTELLAKNINACRDVVESMMDVLEDHNIDSLRGLLGNLSFHDFYTYDHSINVSMYCIQIYRLINPGASRKELMHAGLGGLLHDLGKIKIPTQILNKPEGLSKEEYEMMKAHPDYGLGLLLNGLPDVHEDIDLKIIARVIHEHHENFDGSGYPRRLKGKEEIHLFARVCTIADFFDAITTKRSYNEVLTLQDAMTIMKKSSGAKIDPEIFDTFHRQVRYVKTEMRRELILSDSFDPALPYAKLPVTEVERSEQVNFGKVKVVDTKNKK
jgi:HD-GYP domain-containing protein (c-di-GMP phosphodiesterase class II)